MQGQFSTIVKFKGIFFSYETRCNGLCLRAIYTPEVDIFFSSFEKLVIAGITVEFCHNHSKVKEKYVKCQTTYTSI